MFYKIQPLHKDDVSFLWEMGYEIVCKSFVREGKDPPSRDILKKPELAKYAQNWGRTGDTGFIAINTNNQQHIGLAWYRLYKADNKAYGYIDDETPEISIAVAS